MGERVRPPDFHNLRPALLRPLSSTLVALAPAPNSRLQESRESSLSVSVLAAKERTDGWKSNVRFSAQCRITNKKAAVEAETGTMAGQTSLARANRKDKQPQIL